MAKPSTEVDLTGFGYERLQHVGKGQYASAALVKETTTGETYVAKCISLAALNDHDQELANQEVSLLQTLGHPYIVAYHDSFLIEGSNTLVIVMEYCNGGDLRKVIKDKAKAEEHFPEDQIMTWFVQLCMSLQYCHSEKVLHRDLKTSNIFLTEGGVIKLGDFGISRVLEGTTEAAVTIVGTPYYMSPEVCRSEPYNWKSDIWALGCVLYELCMLKHAFESSSLLGLVYKIVSDHYEPIPSFYSPQLNELIRQLLMKSADQRPTFNQLFSNPYVKGYLARSAHSFLQTPSPPPGEPPAAAPSRPKLNASLRPRKDPPPPPAPSAGSAPPPPPPGPPPLAPQSGVLIIASRIRRRLVGQKLNWLSAFAAFDSEGSGALSMEEMRNALTSMYLGIGEAEIAMLIEALPSAPGAKISLDTFSTYLRDVPPEVLQYEAWARQTLASAGRTVRELLASKDSQRQGTLAPDVFKAALKELAPALTDPQLDLLVLLADKNALGDVDYAEFISVFGPPPPPAPVPAAAPAGPAAPPGMPPVNFGVSGASPISPARPGPSGPPSAPSGGSPAPAAAPLDLAMTLTLGDVNAMTFFSCASANLLGNATVPRVSLSPEGCAIIFARICRRLGAVGLSITDALALFTSPGDDLTADQWLEVASVLPLGTSRAEMQQLFSKVDTAEAGRVPVAEMERLIGSASASHCTTAPKWIDAAMRRGLGGRIRDELAKLGGVNGATLARESDFKRVVMSTERYLTSDQLSSLVLLADKNSLGLIDYQDFAERFSGAAPAPLQVPGGALPATASAWSAAASDAVPSPEEIQAVGSRTAAAMERQGFSPERLPALLALWAGALPSDVAAKLLASLPLGLSHQEASGLMQALGGNVSALAAHLEQLRSQGIWRSWCEWAAGNIPGPSLRAVLQRQVVEAECRTLDPSEFVRNLTDAGVKAESTPVALWLAEKTEQGDICVAEFLTNFGGAPAEEQKKKKRGLRYRFWGR